LASPAEKYPKEKTPGPLDVTGTPLAGACAANRLAILIPCHRVIRSDGGLGGYRWGVAWKQALLARERAFIKG